MLDVPSAAVQRGRMSVCETRVFRGPHLHSQLPMIRIELDLGALEEFPTNKLEGFTDRLLQALPGLREHGCSYGEAGGLVRRMHEGTWLGHVAEHAALELQCMAGSRLTRGKTRSVKDRERHYYVMYTYLDEQLGLPAGRLALELIDSLLPAELRGIDGLDRVAAGPVGPGFAAGLARLKEIAVNRALGPTTASLVHEAERRRIPFERLDNSSLFLLGQGRHQQRVRASCSDLTSEVATEIAADKDLTKTLLSRAGLPVPKGELVRSVDEARAAAERLGYPVVTKPLDGNHGRGVTINISAPDQVQWGFDQAREHGRTVIVEQFYTGADHRILVIGGEVVAVAERVPAHVVGDGSRTISQLIDEVNADPRRGHGHSSVLTRIEIDEAVRAFLQRSNMTPSSIPTRGEAVMLRPTANISTGGTAVDRTDELHPDNALICRRAAQIVGLDIAGIDFVCPNIRESVLETGGGIIEVNAGPGFRMHLEPFQGRPRNVARPVLELLFPKGTEGRIPTFAITGTNGKSTTARMLAHILQSTGVNVGLTSTTGVYLNNHRIITGDCSGPQSARTVLREPSIDVAVLECARGGILREGLAFDVCDVGAVLNVAEDHLGLRGVDTIEDLAAVKSVVVESVRRSGWSILNADNEYTAGMARRAGGSICFFSLREPNEWPEFLREHVRAGGRAICREPMEDGWDLVIHENNESIYLMKAGDIPATFGGAAEFNVANALAAVAMAHCHGVLLKTIRSALQTFTTSFDQSPGRMNVFDGHGFRTIVDYCHNPDGLKAISKLIHHMRPKYRRTIGLIGIAGDRRDTDVLEMGALAARTFDLVIFKEDDELRGRRPGTLAGLLREGALSTGCPPDRIEIVLAEVAAIEHCLRLAGQDDLVLLTADHVEAAWQQVVGFDKTGSPKGAPEASSPLVLETI
jgi:cyanophycin synthetase